MKGILQHSITIISELATLILGLVWYQSNNEIEPIIVMIGSSTFLIISLLSFVPINKDEIKKQVLGGSRDNYLDKDFLYNYIPGDLSIDKVIEDFGQPLVKIKDFIEQEWNGNAMFEFNVYKYKFSNAVVLFTTLLNDNNIISISLISSDNKNPIMCRYSPAEKDLPLGTALITPNIIDNSQGFESNMYASWMYSALTSRYGDYRPIKYLYFTLCITAMKIRTI